MSTGHVQGASAHDAPAAATEPSYASRNILSASLMNWPHTCFVLGMMSMSMSVWVVMLYRVDVNRFLKLL